MKKRLVLLGLSGLLSATVMLSACAPANPHPAEGWNDCISCHGQNGDKPYPKWHVEGVEADVFGVRGNDTCTNCHKFARDTNS